MASVGKLPSFALMATGSEIIWESRCTCSKVSVCCSPPPVEGGELRWLVVLSYSVKWSPPLLLVEEGVSGGGLLL